MVAIDEAERFAGEYGQQIGRQSGAIVGQNSALEFTCEFDAKVQGLRQVMTNYYYFWQYLFV